MRKLKDYPNAQNVVGILKSGVKKDGLLTHVISEGYAGYDSGIKTLEELTGCKLKVPAAGLTADVDYLNCFRIPGY